MKHVTLLFLRREGQILLAMKKRGFGAGKWNGVGGKIEPGETPEQAAVRECQEEIHVTPRELRAIGEIDFKQPEGDMNVHVFWTDTWDGEPKESEEMAPKWYDVNTIPYDEMWPDDEYWLPLLLENKRFTARFELDHNDVITDHSITLI